MYIKHKFVVLGNGNDWCEISYADIKKNPNAKLMNRRLPCPYDKFLSRIAKLHYSQTLSHYFDLPWKEKWFSYFAKCMCLNENERLVIIVFDKHLFANDINFLSFLKRHFKNVKLVYVFTNIFLKSGAFANNFLNEIKKYYDLVYTYDFGDADKYDFQYFPNVYSAMRNPSIISTRKCFFVGKAKDRLNMLLSVYERMKSTGIDCDFHIVGVPLEKQQYKESIVYNKVLPYKQVVEKVQESCCLLDITQGESEGFTLRVNEAVYYDKLLITNNKSVKKAPFYNPDYIKIISSPEDIDQTVFEKWKSVNYSLEDKKYFAVESFLLKIENDLM